LEIKMKRLSKNIRATHENALLGSMILLPDIVGDVLATVSVDTFSCYARQEIFCAIDKHEQDGESIDAASLRATLRERNSSQKWGRELRKALAAVENTSHWLDSIALLKRDGDPWTRAEIKRRVWSGYCERVDVFIGIMYQGEDKMVSTLDLGWVRSQIDKEFRRKQTAELTWPDVTDCDRLDIAFAELRSHGITALQNAGRDPSEAFARVEEHFTDSCYDGVSHTAYCWFTEKDVETALESGRLGIGYGTVHPDGLHRLEIGRSVARVLRGHGFTVRWDEDPGLPIMVEGIQWQRRLRKQTADEGTVTTSL
jgi:hypothetical protein